MKKNVKLNTLKVQSFVTSDQAQEIKGGRMGAAVTRRKYQSCAGD